MDTVFGVKYEGGGKTGISSLRRFLIKINAAKSQQPTLSCSFVSNFISSINQFNSIQFNLNLFTESMHSNSKQSINKSRQSSSQRIKVTHAQSSPTYQTSIK
jgi:hypothetical protein